MAHAGTVIALAALLLLTPACTELPTGLPGAPRTCGEADRSVSTYPTDSLSVEDNVCAENYGPGGRTDTG